MPRPVIKRSLTGSLGFSLIELVVVIAILGILISIAVPNFLTVQKDAQINTIKSLLTTVNKECIVSGARTGGQATSFGDIRSWKTVNKYGADASHPGWGWRNWTYDTSLTSSQPIRTSDSCYQLAAMSTTSPEENGMPAGSYRKNFADFQISYDEITGVVRKTCVIKNPGFTYDNGSCRSLSASSGGGLQGIW